MIAKVKRNLNIRTRPDTAAERVGIVLAGKEIEVLKAVPGQPIEGNATWYADSRNNYYWSGALDVLATDAGDARGIAPVDIPIRPSFRSPFADVFVDYPDLLRKANALWVGAIQPASVQQQVMVVVMDSGVFEAHPDFGNAFRSGLAAQNFAPSPTSKDIFGHGTHMGGLIGGRTDDKPGIIGSAPLSILRSVKVTDDEGITDGKGLLQALQSLNSTNVHILNLSFDVNYRDYQLIASELQRIAGFATIVAAAGNNDKLTAPFLLFPAMSPDVISVGAVHAEYYQQVAARQFNNRLDFIMPEWPLLSCSTKEKGFYKEESGSSMATALVSGLAATLVSPVGILNTGAVRQVLKQLATSYPLKPDYNTLTLLKP